MPIHKYTCSWWPDQVLHDQMISTLGWTDDAPGLVEPRDKKIMVISCLVSLYLFNVSVVRVRVYIACINEVTTVH